MVAIGFVTTFPSPRPASEGRATTSGALVPATAMAITDDFNAQTSGDYTSLKPQWTPFNPLILTTGDYLSLNPSGVSGAYCGIYGAGGTLINRYAQVQIVQRLAAVAGTVATMQIQLDGSNFLEIGQTDADLVANVVIAGTQTQLARISWPSGAQWLRIYESAGTVYWAYSSDGHSWTALASRTDPFALTSCSFFLVAGCYGTVATPGTALFDNVNLQPGRINAKAATGSAIASGAISKVPTFIKVTKFNTFGSGAGGTFTQSITAIAGNTLFAIVARFQDGSLVTRNLTLSGGGSWFTDSQYDAYDTADTSTTGLAFASCPSTTGGSITLSFAWSGTPDPTDAFTGWIYEFSGISGSPLLDAAGTGSHGIASSPVATTSLTNPTAGDLMLAAGTTFSTSNETHGSPSNGWTMPSGADEPDAAYVTGVTAYKFVSSSAAQSTSWTNSPIVDWSSLIIAYKTAAAAGPSYKNLTGNAAGVASVSVAVTDKRALAATSTGIATVSVSISDKRLLGNVASAGLASDSATPTRRRPLTASSAGVASVSVALSDKRALTATAPGVASVSVQISDKRALTATAPGIATVSVQISDKRLLGSVSSAGHATTTGVVTGRPTLIASITGVATVSASITARRSLTASAPGAASVAVQLSDKRALSATSAGIATVSVAISDKRSLTASAPGVATVSAAISDKRLLGSVAAAGVATASGSISKLAGGGFRDLVAIITGIATASALLTDRRVLSASSSGVASASAVISDRRLISAAASGSSGSDALLSAKRLLSVSAAGVASASASATARRSLTASASGVSTVSVALRAGRSITATATGVATDTATISKITLHFGDLTASAAGVATSSATITDRRALSATAVAAATAAGLLIARRVLSASASGAAVADAPVTARRSLAASAAGVAVSSGQTTRARYVTATALGSSTASAQLLAYRQLSVTAAGQSTVSASLTARRSLLVVSAGAGTVTVALTARRSLRATAAGQAIAIGSPTPGRAFASVDADISVDGWVNQLGGPASYTQVNEEVADDSNYVQSPFIGTGETAPLIMSLQDMVDPGPTFGLKLTIRARAPAGGGLRVDVLDAHGLLIATRAFRPTSGFGNMELALNQSETADYRAGAGFTTGGQLRLIAVMP